MKNITKISAIAALVLIVLMPLTARQDLSVDDQTVLVLGRGKPKPMTEEEKQQLLDFLRLIQEAAEKAQRQLPEDE